MPLQREAMTKANFDRSEQGLPPLKEVKVVRPDDVMPDAEDELKALDVTAGEDIKFDIKLGHATRVNRRNEDGVLFIGYDVSIDVISKDDTTTMKGWMVEGEFQQFVRNHRKQIDQQVINW